MMTLYFVHPDARLQAMSVALVNDGEALDYGQEVTVSNELGKKLLATGDWQEQSPADSRPKRRRTSQQADAEAAQVEEEGKQDE